MRLTKGYFLIFLLFPYWLIAQTHWHRVKINLSGKSFAELQATGVAFDHGTYTPGVSFIGNFTDDELDKIRHHGFDFEPYAHEGYLSTRTNTNCPFKVEVPPSYNLPFNYEYGSMGGFQTYKEMLSNLDLMKQLYPNLITSKKSIRNYTTADGNKIYYVKISDNPDRDEDEPEVLYTGLHHAREPISASQLFFFMWYLLENYYSDSAVAALVNSRELYFVPCLNPDGYVYNEKTDPRGGGYWRKNRSINAVDTGVDLNRNYSIGWGFDNLGSSPDGKSDTYRGPRAFSEVETRAIRDFCEDRHFKIALNYHAFGNLLLIPWGYLNRPTIDSVQYFAMAAEMVRYNKFKVGTSANLLNYTVNGISDDYMYGEQFDKNKIFVFTPEVGLDFWPHRRDILPLNISTQYMNWVAAWQAGAYASMYDEGNVVVDDVDIKIKLRIRRSGLENEKIVIQPVDNGQVVQHEKEFTEFYLPMGGDTTIFFPIRLLQKFSFGQVVKVKFELKTGEFKQHYTVDVKYTGPPVWKDECTLLENWIFLDGPDWGLTTEDFTSKPSSMTDSPNGSAEPFASKKVRSVLPIDLRDATEAFLSFNAKWELDEDFDFAQIQVSDNGEVFEPLCGMYTREGKISQDFRNPIYSGNQKQWITEWIDLRKYLGKVIQIQLYIYIGQNRIPKDGFYFDDLKVYAKIPTRADQKTAHGSFSIHPNPVRDKVAFTLPENYVGKAIELDILDAQSREIFSQKLVGQPQISIDVNHLAKGMYWLRLSAANHEVVLRKFIID